jgi:nucleoside-triphosphatase THEP1
MGSWLTGLASGVQMTLRALFVVSAFGGISVELRNPRIVNWFLRRGLGALGSALDAAFRTLPTMVSALGEHRSVLRHPVLALSRMFAVVLREMTLFGGGQHEGPMVFILTGAQGSGKTSLLQNLVPLVRRHGRTAAGIRAPMVMDNGTRAGYNVEDVRTGDMLPLCRLGQENAAATAGPFGFDPDGLRFGLDALSLDAVAQRDIVLLDEIGPLELQGGGWAPALRTLLQSYTGHLVLVIRPGILSQAMEQWGLQPAAVWEPGVTRVSDIAARLAD